MVITRILLVMSLMIPLHASVAQHHVAAGVLTCEQAGTRINLIIHSTGNIACEFKDTEGNIDRYKGETGVGLGVDLQWKKEESMVFTVLASVGGRP